MPIEISRGVTIVNLEKFLEIYEARCESVSVLSDGVIERMELYKIAINESK